MTRTQNVNIGGYPFTIDEQAYHYLQDYLGKIEDHFRKSEGFEEIIDDIEQRMAELLEERTKAKRIVSHDDVAHAISILGTTADFGAEDADQEQGYSKGPKSSYTTGRKLFRDPDDNMIGGVCAGLAAYFGIQDVIWVRIAFVAAAAGGGIGVPVYLLMWALVAQATTPKDFLSMRGEPINVANIAKIVEEQVEHISDQISDIGSGWKSKHRKKKCGRRERKSWKDRH